MKRNSILYIFIFSLLAVNLIIGIINLNNSKKAGFVITGELVSRYAGVKDVQEAYTIKYNQWQNEIDTLISYYDNEVQYFKNNEPNYTEEKKEIEKEKLIVLGDKISNYKKNLENKATEENRKMLEGVLNQINNFIERYAEEHSYSYIIGATDMGNVLYSEKSLDITEDLIKAINEEYEGY